MPLHGTWTATGGGGGGGALAGVGAVVVIGALAYEVAKGAARMLGEAVIIGGTALVALAVGVGVTLLAVRLRGRRRADAVIYDVKVTQPQLWQPNPHVVPARPQQALPAPAPVVINIDAGLLAGLLREAQRQHAPVIIPSETEELPR